MRAANRLLASPLRHLSKMPASEDAIAAVGGTSDTLLALRKLLIANHLDALMVPSEDYHNSEYLADCDKRRQFLTNFTGSAGIAVVTPSSALLWTDGRYHLQVNCFFNDGHIL